MSCVQASTQPGYHVNKGTWGPVQGLFGQS